MGLFILFKEVMVISFKKYFLIFSALIILVVTVLWQEITRSTDDYQIIIIENPPETILSQTAKTLATVEKTTKAIKTTVISQKIISEKSAYTTKVNEKIAEIEEICTETEDLYIDINNADFDELIRLKGIGNYLAEQIITYREENGGFRNIEEIINVSGIGEKTFELICDCIYVENPVYDTEEISDEPELYVEIIEEITTEEITEIPLTLEDYVPINLNEADIEILMLLPCIDEETAQDIIDFRTKVSGLSHIYELLHIEGITEEMLTEIIEYVYV